MGGWMETLFEPDWTLDPAVFDYKLTILDPKFVKGRLAESWEFSDRALWSSTSVRASTGRTSRRLTAAS
jgi:hypothetical protein